MFLYIKSQQEEVFLMQHGSLDVDEKSLDDQRVLK